MLHELLLALSGDSGGVFVHKKFAGLQVCITQLNILLWKRTSLHCRQPWRQYLKQHRHAHLYKLICRSSKHSICLETNKIVSKKDIFLLFFSLAH